MEVSVGLGDAAESNPSPYALRPDTQYRCVCSSSWLLTVPMDIGVNSSSLAKGSIIPNPGRTTNLLRQVEYDGHVSQEVWSSVIVEMYYHHGICREGNPPIDWCTDGQHFFFLLPSLAAQMPQPSPRGVGPQINVFALANEANQIDGDWWQPTARENERLQLCGLP